MNTDSLGIYSTGWIHYPTAWGHCSTLNSDPGHYSTGVIIRRYTGIDWPSVAVTLQPN